MKSLIFCFILLKYAFSQTYKIHNPIKENHPHKILHMFKNKYNKLNVSDKKHLENNKLCASI